MQKQSPPKHRHDGTSPLPLGMDWSPPPRKWNGRDTIWPHDPRTGWSYCITIPSWVVLPKSRNSEPVVFYRVQVGLQSPEGITTTRGVLRRFNDFLKLFTALKKTHPKKNLPSAPPKGLLRMKSKALLEERRCSLEEWMTKLLSDIDISRSMSVASFLELEAAARSSFQDENLHTNEPNSSTNAPNSPLRIHTSSTSSTHAGTSSLASDYGSDTAYETSEIGSPSLGRDNNSEIATEDLSIDEDLSNPIEKLVKYGMSNIDEGLFMGQAILEQLEGFPRHLENNLNNGSSSKVIGHVRKVSNESVGSEISSLRGSESSSHLGFPANNAFGDGSPTEVLEGELGFTKEAVQLVLPLEQQQRVNKVLVSMQRRLVTAKTDMEDLISRLNNEVAVKDYLTTKVKDLEVELETTKQKSKENLEQAILIERERFTQMQWDMEELRRKSLELEFKLKSKQDENPELESREVPVFRGKDTVVLLQQELDTTKQQLNSLRKQHQEMEAKSKADIKVLVKEIKSLRNSQVELKQKLNQSFEEKSEAERLLQKERENTKNAIIGRRKLLNECEILCNQLQECNINLFGDENDGDDDSKLLMKIKNSSSLPDAMNLISISDNQIGRLFTEVEAISQVDDYTASADVKIDNETRRTDGELRMMLSNILTDNARLRKQVNSVIRRTLKLENSCEKNGKEDSAKGILEKSSVER